ncbi:MAG: HNH endonuclease [Candidatus Methanoplasma sp.]|jgi:putative restriction endonuclease|nr:HNH endonuclease [Candidatus Methanoplasma sp.]
MPLPPLNIQLRDRVFRLYSRREREAVVMAYLFRGLPHRKIDDSVLGLDSTQTKGWQSMGILHHYGITDEFKGIFCGKSVDQILNSFPENQEYDFLYDILKESANEKTECSEYTVSGKIGLDKKEMRNVRVNQSDFRSKILTAYGSSCCVTGIREPQLLRASHIKPWCESNEFEKVDVHNGLCLNALHDCAFDCGIITVESGTHRIKLSSKIEETMDAETYDEYFRRYDTAVINAARSDDGPADSYLDYHNKNIFEKRTNRIKIVYETVIDQLF